MHLSKWCLAAGIYLLSVFKITCTPSKPSKKALSYSWVVNPDQSPPMMVFEMLTKNFGSFFWKLSANSLLHKLIFSATFANTIKVWLWKRKSIFRYFNIFGCFSRKYSEKMQFWNIFEFLPNFPQKCKFQYHFQN